MIEYFKPMLDAFAGFLPLVGMLAGVALVAWITDKMMNGFDNTKR